MEKYAFLDLKEDILLHFIERELKIISGKQQFRSVIYILDELFTKRLYFALDVKDRDVFDIGAFCGETAVYFAKRGARKVFAFEPLYAYRFIDLNSRLNYVEDKVVSQRAAILKDHRGLYIKDSKNTYGHTLLSSQIIEDTSQGIFVQSQTLADLANLISDKEAVLKMDIEGGEFEIILNSDMSVLKKFSEILVECHWEYGDCNEIIHKLRDANFETVILESFPATAVVFAKQKNRT
jgi:FkbM family methyltransferase